MINPGSKSARSLMLYLYIFLFLFSFGLDGKTNDDFLQRLIVNSWNVESGLPQNSVLTMVQSREGYIWFGTQSGLVRFDGVNFKTFTRWNTPDLASNQVLKLYEDADGTLWIGTGAGLSSLKGGEFDQPLSKIGLSSDRVTTIARDDGGDLWVGTPLGLNRIRGEAVRVYGTADGLENSSIKTLLIDSGNRLLVGTEEGLFRLVGDVFVPLPDPAVSDEYAINTLFEDSLSRIWLGTDGGLKRLNGGRILTVSGVFTSLPVQAVGEDVRGRIWAGSDGGGLGILDGARWHILSPEAGNFPGESVHSICRDHEGSMWIGTFASGLSQVKLSKLSTITMSDGLPENMVHTVLVDRSGTLWAGTRNSGLCEIVGDRVTRIFKRRDGLTDNRIRSLMEDRDGILWVGTEGGGICRLRGDRLIPLPDGLQADRISVMVQARDGSVWIGTDRGLFISVEGRLRGYADNHLLPDRRIRTIIQLRNGDMVIGTRRGWVRISNQRLLSHTDTEMVNELDINALYEDGPGVIWIGTDGGGLFKLQENRLSQFSTDRGLPSNTIYTILESAAGELWLGTIAGVCRLPRKSLPELDNADLERITPVTYVETDGMKSRECIGGSQPSAWNSASGRAYFSTAKGIAVFDLGLTELNPHPPKVIIESVVADNRSIRTGQLNVQLKRPNMIEFDFAALSYWAPEKIKFRYRLDGYENEWNETREIHDRVALYLNLYPGRYTFQITACNNDGIWNDEGASFSFRISNPFFRGPLFFAILFLLLLLAFTIMFLLVKRQRSVDKPEKYRTSALDQDLADKVVPRLLSLMEEEKIYVDPDLTLKILSERLMIHYNYLSQIINERFNQSFNDFVNKYRIQEAKKRLLDPAQRDKTILEIAFSTGFYSKSVFNTSFKKFTGLTPSQYRRSNNV